MRGICLLTGCLLTLALAAAAAAAATTGLTGDERAAPAAGGIRAGAAAPAVAAEAVAEPATGATTLTTGPAEPTYPYTGKIGADLVNIRSGPGLYYYPLTTLGKGDEVVVESERNGWLALRPPDSVFGLMR